jgi:hypothetical protein
MKIFRNFACGALLLTAMSTGLSAQDTNGFAVGGSVLSGVGRTADLGDRIGFGINAAYYIQNEGFAVRPGVGFNYLLGSGVRGVVANSDALAGAGKDIGIGGSTLKTDLTNMQVFTDVVAPIFNKKGNFVVGLSLNRYKFAVSGATPGQYSPLGLDAATRDSAGVPTGDANGSATVKGYKLGLRLGFEYRVSNHVSAQVLLQQTELGRTTAALSHLNSLNPSWLTFGVTYKY